MVILTSVEMFGSQEPGDCLHDGHLQRGAYQSAAEYHETAARTAVGTSTTLSSRISTVTAALAQSRRLRHREGKA
jgi:hypothetical protein